MLMAAAVTVAHAQEKLYHDEFPLGDVTLLDGPLKKARDLNIKTLLQYNCDRLLAPYRKEAGLEPKAKTYPNWETSEVLHNGDDYLQFRLVYPAFSAAGKMTYVVTMRRGERFFRNDVSFERMPKGFFAGPGLDVDPGRMHKGVLAEAPGLVSLFEDERFDAKGNAEGSTMAAVFVDDPSQVTPMTDHVNCRVLAFKGRSSFTYWAGACWSGAGEITTPAAWLEHVKKFRAAQGG